MILIDELNAGQLATYPNERHDCPCEGDFSVDGLRAEFIQEGALQQFISALYCDKCGVGFVPNEMLKTPRQKWALSKEGWHPVNSDGSLGPPKQRAD
jgi:hypothetical protein